MNSLGGSKRINRGSVVVAKCVKPCQIDSMDFFVVLLLAITLCLLRLNW